VSKVKPTLISILAIGLLAGSALGVAAQAEDGPATASAGCDEPLGEPGVYEGINDFEDAAQAYRVVVPEGYAELAPAPLILWLAAGDGGLAASFEVWQPYLDEAESIFVVAEQTAPLHRGASTLTGLIDQLIAGYCIDPQRVSAMGMSSSASTVARLACDASTRIGSFFAGVDMFRPSCTPERPVPLMAMTGDSDRIAVSISVEGWAEAYGCDPEPIVEDLGSGVTRTAYQGCQADIVLYDVEGVGHGAVRHECLHPGFFFCYENEVFDLLREVELFFAEHPLPAAE